MKKITSLLFSLTLLLAFTTSCNKDDITDKKPGGPANPGNPHTPAETYTVNVKAVIGVGAIIYDSIPASLEITTWDASNTPHRRQVALQAGANTLALPKAHVRYQLTLTKWGIADEMTFTKDQVAEGTLISLGGSKAARKLRLEEKFLFAEGAYQPNGRTVYSYRSNGTLQQVDYFQKKPQSAELQLTVVDRYLHTGGKVDRVDRLDGHGNQTGFTAFTYNAEGTKIVNMHQKSYDQDIYAAVEHAFPAGGARITIDYLYANGHAMEYVMRMAGGNKVEDAGLSSTGGSEGGSYTYDFNINPFAHMNMPNLYLSHLSKNNLTGGEKRYSGAIPSVVPYRYDYSYDSEGYPTELVTSYKSYATGDHVYKVKTVYTY